MPGLVPGIFVCIVSKFAFDARIIQKKLLDCIGPTLFSDINREVIKMIKSLKSMSILIPVLLFVSITSVQASEEMIIEKLSPLGFDETIARIKANAKELGWKVPKKWKKNFQKNLKKVTKQDIGKNLVFSMCEPFEAVKLLKHDKYKKFLAMMPCSFAVYEKSDGKVYASAMNIQMMGQMYKGEKEIEDLVNKLGPQMVKMMDFE